MGAAGVHGAPERRGAGAHAAGWPQPVGHQSRQHRVARRMLGGRLAPSAAGPFCAHCASMAPGPLGDPAASATGGGPHGAAESPAQPPRNRSSAWAPGRSARVGPAGGCWRRQLRRSRRGMTNAPATSLKSQQTGLTHPSDPDARHRRKPRSPEAADRACRRKNARTSRQGATRRCENTRVAGGNGAATGT